jgi:hypothetical protein
MHRASDSSEDLKDVLRRLFFRYADPMGQLGCRNADAVRWQRTGVPEDAVQIAGMRTRPGDSLGMQRLLVHAAPYIRPADRQPHPDRT